jgi:hypothetical protein
VVDGGWSQFRPVPGASRAVTLQQSDWNIRLENFPCYHKRLADLASEDVFLNDM